MAGAQPQVECSFCGKSQHQVWWLFVSNSGVYICEECVSIAHDILATAAPGAEERTSGAPRVRCSFCGKSWDDNVRLIDTLFNPAYICNECVDRCQAIIDQKARNGAGLASRTN